MPLFHTRKVSRDETQRRLEQRLVVAKESPESTFDLSDCGITELPKDVFSLCRVLRKQTVLLNDNDLPNLKGGGQLKDLADARILVLSNNRLTSLPADLDELRSLQVLDVANNKLKSLPKAIGGLSSLQTLDVQGNNLQSLPLEIGNLKLLRSLNVSNNPKLDALPASLAYCRLLEEITLDMDKISVPPKEITQQGVAAILKYLCQCAGIEYEPSSKQILKSLDPACDSCHSSVDPIDKLVADKKQEQMWMLEKQMRELDSEQQALANQANRSHDDLLQRIQQAEADMDSDILWEQYKQESRRDNMSSLMAADEQLNSDTVAMILQINERSGKREALLDQLEIEKLRTDHLVKVTQDEEERLRKEEVIASMARLLENRRNQERILNEYESTRQQAMRDAIKSEVEANSQVQDVLSEQDQDRGSLKRQISTQEHAQMQAIQALQLQKDAKHRRLTDQIGMLQDELAYLTAVELEKRDEEQEAEKVALAAKRESITSLMSQLVDQQRQREGELMKRLVEMEERRVTDVEDYWLIQYQRLLDSKPQSLLEKECDHVIADVLKEAEAEQYCSLFARHRITWKMLKSMTSEELKEMGIHERGIRKGIMAVVEARALVEGKARRKEKEISQAEDPERSHPQPSAPPVEATATPTMSNCSLYPECVICLDNRSDVVMLPCGHVCCCSNCAGAVSACPICRQTLSQRVRMYIS
ncbi:E3 ubiquitin-protein ligase LRSAM1 isoform X2 [Nematostella vectensis]|uniref:E3 ubiquitin-protein ligase LRSAM1 isoform X2 n=1 Tax=Nematostella vectensis TaxID=45351 RepID=UPI00138FD3A6|nr:E3 ubiquitin-protein ligase LRSAM1 isoform X2 [Nematostella vectensis]